MTVPQHPIWQLDPSLSAVIPETQWRLFCKLWTHALCPTVIMKFTSDCGNLSAVLESPAPDIQHLVSGESRVVTLKSPSLPPPSEYADVPQGGRDYSWLGLPLSQE